MNRYERRYTFYVKVRYNYFPYVRTTSYRLTLGEMKERDRNLKEAVEVGRIMGYDIKVRPHCVTTK